MNSRNKKIVIFDDDEDIVSICTYISEEQGWNVFAFTDCIQITERVSDILPDVILMDNWIPNEGGIAATQTLKSKKDLQHIPVIYFTANSDIESLANQAGAESFLAKPFDLEELERVINQVIVNIK